MALYNLPKKIEVHVTCESYRVYVSGFLSPLSIEPTLTSFGTHLLWDSPKNNMSSLHSLFHYNFTMRLDVLWFLDRRSQMIASDNVGNRPKPGREYSRNSRVEGPFDPLRVPLSLPNWIFPPTQNTTQHEMNFESKYESRINLMYCTL